MSQNHARKQAAKDQENRGYLFGSITNIESTLQRFLQKEMQESFRLGYRMPENAVRNSFEVKILEDTFTRGLLNARIIMNRDENNKG